MTIAERKHKFSDDPKHKDYQYSNALLSDFSIEVTPPELLKIGGVGSQLPKFTRVFLPILPKLKFQKSIEAAERLSSIDMIPVPHIAARRLKSRDHLEELLGEFCSRAKVRQVLIIAGDSPQIVGPYASSSQVIATGLFERFGIERIFIGAHPEGSPDISSAQLNEALQWKSDYAKTSSAQFEFVTQFTFSSSEVIALEKKIRDMDIPLPMRVGVPAPANLLTLFKFAKICGMGASVRQWAKREAMLKNLVRDFSADGFISELENAQTHQSVKFSGLHVYSFGGYHSAAKWITEKQANLPILSGYTQEKNTE